MLIQFISDNLITLLLTLVHTTHPLPAAPRYHLQLRRPCTHSVVLLSSGDCAKARADAFHTVLTTLLKPTCVHKAHSRTPQHVALQGGKIILLTIFRD